MKEQVSRKILVVDDDQRWLKKISKVLSEYDLTLIDVPSEALLKLKQEPFHLTILDMRLADGASGLDLFAQMQVISSGLQALILTGFPDTKSMRRSFKEGVVDYLEKGNPDLAVELQLAVKEAFKEMETATSPVADLIAKGESEVLEFKASARWDTRTEKINKDLEKVVIRTVASFLNSEKGGRLLIGVDDNGMIVGIEPDCQTLQRKDLDGYESYLTSLLLGAFGKDLSLSLSIMFHQTDEGDICEILARPSPRAVFVSDEKGEHLYVRTGNSTRLLSTREAIEYSKVRWKG
jgi:ActR/RegA family two-component response regulator